MALGRQVRKYREKNGMTMTELANRVSDLVGKNVEMATIRAMETRDSKSSQYTPFFAKIFGLTVEQLLDERRDYVDDPVGEAKPEVQTYVPIPIINARLGCSPSGYENGDNIEIVGNWNMPIQFLKELGVSAANAEIVFAYSYSMFPTIRNGAHVLLNRADTTLRDGKIYAVNINGEMLLKRLFHEGGNWVLRSDNPDKNEFPDRILPKEETTKVCGRVVWFDVRL